MTADKISVIIPVYNSEKYLCACLDSLLAQTHANLEILLADDGSTDQSGSICDAYAAKDPRFRVFHLPHRGVAHARNACLDAVSGDFIAFLDSDDWLDADTYEFMLKQMEEHGSDIVQVGLTMEKHWGKFLRNHQPMPVIPVTCETFITEDLWHILSNETANKLFRAEVIRDIRFDCHYTVAEDMLFVMQALERTRSIVFCNDGKYHYRQHNDSSYNRWNDPLSWESMWEVYDLADRRYAGEPYARKRFRTVLFWCTLDICQAIATDYRSDRVSTRRAISRSLRRHPLRVVTVNRIPQKDRVKLVLIAFCWPLYRKIIIRK